MLSFLKKIHSGFEYFFEVNKQDAGWGRALAFLVVFSVVNSLSRQWVFIYGGVDQSLVNFVLAFSVFPIPLLWECVVYYLFGKFFKGEGRFIEFVYLNSVLKGMLLFIGVGFLQILALPLVFYLSTVMTKKLHGISYLKSALITLLALAIFFILHMYIMLQLFSNAV